jgi:hypothetical protein
VAACGRVDTEVGAEPVPPLVSAVYLEAESGQLSGFTVEDDPEASGGKYILPPPLVDSTSAPGTASAQYVFSLDRSGAYYVWGRIRGPGALNNSFWVSMDDGAYDHWFLSTGVVWFWGRVTDRMQYGQPVSFPLDAGTHHLVFRNSAPEVGLDRLYIASSGAAPPVPPNATPCDPPNSIQTEDGGCSPSCGSHGVTTCGAACTGLPAIPSYDCTVCCLVSGGGSDGGAAPDGNGPGADAAVE